MYTLKFARHAEKSMGNLTFLSEVMDAYLSVRWGVSATYREDVQRAVRQFEAWHGRRIALRNLDENLLGRFLRDYSQTHTPRSTNNRRRQLLTLWKFAAEEYQALPLPRRIPKLQEPQRIPQGWTLAECERIFQAAARRPGVIAGIPAGDWWLALLLVVYWTGERIGAVRHIHCSDYDTERMALRIRPEHQKTKKERIFYLPPEIHSIIMRIYNPSRELLFPWNRDSRRIWPRFRTILKDAGIKHDPKRPMNLFHKLRRTSGTLCQMNGGSGAAHLGHSEAIFRRSYYSPNISGNWQSEKVPLPHIEF